MLVLVSLGTRVALFFAVAFWNLAFAGTAVDESR